MFLRCRDVRGGISIWGYVRGCRGVRGFWMVSDGRVKLMCLRYRERGFNLVGRGKFLKLEFFRNVRGSVDFFTLGCLYRVGSFSLGLK